MSEKIIQYIKQSYQKKLSKNKRYSLRSFAKNLGIEHSSLNKILKGDRKLTLEKANSILTALKTSASTKNSLLLTLVDKRNFTDIPEVSKYVTLTENELSQTYNWYYYAILASLEIKTVKPTVSGLATFLGVNEASITKSVNALIKIGALEMTDQKTLKLTGKRYTTTNKVFSESLYKAHLNHIHQATDVLKNIKKLKPNTTVYCGFTMAAPVSKLDEANRRIIEFGRSLSAWLNAEDEDKDQVYRLNIQLFPLSKNTAK